MQTSDKPLLRVVDNRGADLGTEAIAPERGPLPALPSDVRAFFESQHASFGAMNLLPDHLPDEDDVRRLVKNTMTVDYAIGRAFRLPLYERRVLEFAEHSRTGALPGVTDRAHIDAYALHGQALREMNNEALAQEFEQAVGQTMLAFNLFSPKQCHLACRGCYTGALSVLRRPFDEERVESYYFGAKQIIAQSAAMGAKVVYTSGDGEPTIYPRFFDLLEHVQAEGMQWLFFTAGLSFSSEAAARHTWSDIVRYASANTVARIGDDIDRFEAQGEAKPTVRAFLAELARRRDSIQVYHSVWATDAALNERLRNPLTAAYDYSSVDVRGTSIELPSSIPDMLEHLFPEPHRGRFGIEMPVAAGSAAGVPLVATFVVDQGIRSYFEPVIVTGRNQKGALKAPREEDLTALSPLLVRSLCSFRNIHQPTIKLRDEDGAFYASPGMGVDLGDLEKAGVLEATRVHASPSGLFAAIHAPTIVDANFGYVTGCKCNDFSSRLINDREGVAREWRDTAAAFQSRDLSATAVMKTLSSAAQGT